MLRWVVFVGRFCDLALFSCWIVCFDVGHFRGFGFLRLCMFEFVGCCLYCFRCFALRVCDLNCLLVGVLPLGGLLYWLILTRLMRWM